MRLLIICCLCILCGVGCASSHLPTFAYFGATVPVHGPFKTIPIYIDINFGEADKLAIDDAIRQWNMALNGNIILKVASTTFDMDIPTIHRCMNGDCWMFMKIRSDNSMVPPNFSTTGITLAWANDVGGNRIYFIRDRIYNEWMTGVALHEIGHLLGAKHDNVYLMQPEFQWSQARCVDYETSMLVAKYWFFNPNSMRYCVYH